MFITALKECNTTSHSLKKGDVVNMRKQDADKLIDSKSAKKATKEDIKKAKG